MPCRSYEDDYARSYENAQYQSLLKNTDKLARIACKAMDALKDSDDPSSFKELMKDPEISTWYTNHKKEDAKHQKMQEAKKKEESLRKQAIAKLTPEELAAFGLSKKGSKETRGVNHEY
jgi:hypothetical protein